MTLLTLIKQFVSYLCDKLTYTQHWYSIRKDFNVLWHTRQN